MDFSMFKRKKLEEAEKVHTPSDHMTLKQLLDIQANNYQGVGGKEYVSGEIDSRIYQLQGKMEPEKEENLPKLAKKEFKTLDHISVSEDDFWDGMIKFEDLYYRPVRKPVHGSKKIEFSTSEDGPVIAFIDVRDEKPKYWLHRKLKPSQMAEDSWASEVGSIRSELGEIEEIYKDFDSIYKRLNGITDVVAEEGKAKITKMLDKAYMTIAAAEVGFREVTKSAKAPARTPIRQSTPVSDPKREMERISSDLAKLSVRVRNIGQATDDLENVEVGTVPDQFEKASDQIRKAFVQFEKLIPFNESRKLDEGTRVDFGTGWVDPKHGEFFDAKGNYHGKVAIPIVKKLYGADMKDETEAKYFLLNKGWIRVIGNNIEVENTDLAKDGLIIFLSKFDRNGAIYGVRWDTVGEFLDNLH